MNKFLILVLLCGCSVGPDFKDPRFKVTQDWIASRKELVNNKPIVSKWWETFNDEKLVSLIDRGMEFNLDLKQAVIRIRQARASRTIATSRFFPQIGSSASYQKSGGDSIDNTELYQAGLDASWEIDIFGGLRRGYEAADAEVIAQEENRNDVMVTLASEIAVNYLNLRGFQQELAITNLNLEAQKKSAELTNKLFTVGFKSGLDAVTASAQVSSTESAIPGLLANIEKTIYQLSYLLGKQPEALKEELGVPGLIPTAPANIPVGIPSEILRRRPDIRRAEAQLQIATANVGVAVADLFPKFNLTGGLNFRGATGSSISSGDNGFWSFAPGVSLPIFNAGRLRANVKIQEAIQETALLEYEKTVLNALKEANGAIVDYHREQERWISLQNAVASNTKAVDISKKLYTAGQTDFLNVLTAQRSLYSTQSALVQSTRTIDTNLVAVYKALGGGWQA